MSTRERSTGKQEEHSFPPRGVVLASISALPCTDLTVNADRPKTLLGLMNEGQLHIVLCQICL